MSVPTIADVNVPPGNFAPVQLARPLIRASVLTCGGALSFAAAFLWFRRAVGAIATPLSASALVTVGLAVAAAALAARLVWRRSATTHVSILAVSGLLSVATLAFTAAASLPDSAPAGLLGMWLFVLGGELWAWWPRRLAISPQEEGSTGRPRPKIPAADARARFEQAIADSSLGMEVSQEHVTQQVTRLVEPNGTERVVGWMRVSFEPGQRLASVHLAFCPPFGRTPEATLERIEGQQVRIKRVQAFPFGARFDLKLSTPAEQRSDVLLHVAAEVRAIETTTDANTPEEPGNAPSTT